MSDQACKCHGIKLLMDLMDEYALWDENKPYMDKTRATVMDLHRHIKTQAKAPGNEAILEKVKDRLAKQENDVANVRFGADPMMALDHLRDDIHQSDEIRQLVVCGAPTESPDENGATLVGIVFELLATPEDEPGRKSGEISVADAARAAKEPLVGYHKTLC